MSWDRDKMNPKMQRPLPTTAFLKHCKTVFSGWTVLFMASGLRSVQSRAALVAPGALLGSFVTWESRLLSSSLVWDRNIKIRSRPKHVCNYLQCLTSGLALQSRHANNKKIKTCRPEAQKRKRGSLSFFFYIYIIPNIYPHPYHIYQLAFL